MPIRLGPLELTIILLIVVLLFGPGRLGKVAGELGKGIRSFRQGIKEEGAEAENKPGDQLAEEKKPPSDPAA
jgi:sec-independent protein translocase protein TatA